MPGPEDSPASAEQRLDAVKARVEDVAARHGLGVDPLQAAVEDLAWKLEQQAVEAPGIAPVTPVGFEEVETVQPAVAEPATEQVTWAALPTTTVPGMETTAARPTRRSKVIAGARRAAGKGAEVIRKVAEDPDAREFMQRVGTSAARGALSSIGVIAERGTDGRLEPQFHDPDATKGRKPKEILKTAANAAAKGVAEDAPDIATATMETRALRRQQRG